ncbi:sensor domain-containing diguanylate cyclase [Xanthomonas hyacinthi]|uniref:diguanylate cyclase n=1 Tax=Xanthomonas hyacinthi TaxID=56455 RepID=A0A2S7F377_9XANT|nr:sensor domain-containing diguanylate cyclase [Xanthomonas hyacinthi]KLD75658.1 diguanylate cyclase [Xanthomonas hyacinthi DSM 19077]PPU99838.1 sensor domain-containing diguanylate cyclase [Xanthomonas hyacinthi]QGY76001.1 sensor domain-containing diguanylate cyclase [Xanthomonas hyacinthi]
MSKGTTQRRNLVQRVALNVFITAAWAMLAASEYSSLRDARSATLRTAQASSLNLASSLAQHTSDSLVIADAVLSGVVARVETGAGRKPKTLHEVLVDAANLSDRLHTVAVCDASGQWVNSSPPRGSQRGNNADQAHFEHHKKYSDGLAFIGRPSHSDGSWTITLSRRVDNADGSFGGVALASIRLEYLQDLGNTFDVGRSGSIAIIYDDGDVVPFRLGDQYLKGASIAGSQIHRTMRELHRGWAIYRSPIDGEEWVAGFAPVRPFPMSLLVSMPSNEVLASWRKMALQRSLITIAGCALFVGLGIWLHLQLRRVHTSEAKLSTEAWIDPLIGIYNRRGFDYKLQRALQQRQVTHSPVSLLMIDVDHFKLYNDTYGHVNGDACLRQVGQAMASCALRLNDVAARYGGEEFAIILPFTDEKGAERVAQQVRSAVRELALPHASSPTDARVTVSIGIACADMGNQQWTVTDLVDKADAALYRAKQAGRDRACT